MRDLQLLVGVRRRAWEETQRKVREAEERRRAQERQQWEERERLRRMVEERSQREARLERIHREQEEALQRERERKASEEVEVSRTWLSILLSGTYLTGLHVCTDVRTVCSGPSDRAPEYRTPSIHVHPILIVWCTHL